MLDIRNTAAVLPSGSYLRHYGAYSRLEATGIEAVMTFANCIQTTAVLTVLHH
jgi:hypothetical protein